MLVHMDAFDFDIIFNSKIPSIYHFAIKTIYRTLIFVYNLRIYGFSKNTENTKGKLLKSSCLLSGSQDTFISLQFVFYYYYYIH